MLFKKKRSKALDVNSQETGLKSIADKHMLQYLDPGRKGECELVIGLDFGTSASKAVIQAPDLPGRPSFAVDFGLLSHKSRPFLLPTKLWMLPNRMCSLRFREGTQLINDIKLELFSKEGSLKSKYGSIQQNLCPEETAAIYLALLLRYSRRWFLETKLDYVRDFERLSWSLNLGVPSPCIEDNEENRRFRRVGKAAWMLSTLEHRYITFEKASAELKHVEDSEYWDTDEEYACDFEIIPEIAAGAVGYALSNLRREGLHVMVDTGASTVDVCSFILKAVEGSDNYSLLIADVKQLGTTKLYDERIVTLKRAYEKHTEGLRDKHDPLVPIQDDIEPFLVTREQFCTADDDAKAQFKKQFDYMLRRVIWQTRCRRAPDAPVWRRGRLPILLIGGGSKLEFYRSAVEELNDWLKQYTPNDGTALLPVPIPSSLTHSGSKLDDNLFLTVAWGLSHRAMDVGNIIPADRIPDVEPPPRRDVHGRYVGKELV